MYRAGAVGVSTREGGTSRLYRSGGGHPIAAVLVVLRLVFILQLVFVTAIVIDDGSHATIAAVAVPRLLTSNTRGGRGIASRLLRSNLNGVAPHSNFVVLRYCRGFDVGACEGLNRLLASELQPAIVQRERAIGPPAKYEKGRKLNCP